MRVATLQPPPLVHEQQIRAMLHGKRNRLSLADIKFQRERGHERAIICRLNADPLRPADCGRTGPTPHPRCLPVHSLRYEDLAIQAMQQIKLPDSG
jgi:hypothetical protein